MTVQKSITSPNELMAVGRMFARTKAPYLATAIYSLIPYPVEKMYETTGYGIGVTPGLVMIYDPEWIMGIPFEQMGFLILHEVNHIIRDHAGRCGHRDHKLFNKAGDLGINHDLVTAGWTMPTGDKKGLLPETYGFPPGLSAEEYYHLLQQHKAEGGKGQKKGKGKGKGASGGGENGEEPPDQGPGNGNCGGIAGNPIDKELEERIDKEIGRTEAAKKGLEKQIQHDIREHLKKNPGRGNVPANLVTWANTPMKRSRIPWTRKLSSVIRRTSGRIQSGGMDYSLSHPSKRSYLRGIIRPGLVQQEPEVAFVLDTSGSMGMAQIKAGLREGYAVMNSLGVDTVWWLEADAAVANVPQRIGIRQLTHMKIHGGGGTDFGPGIAACEKLRPKPDILIYFTDGDGGAPQNPPPGIEVVWCIVPSYYNKRPASWGHAIIMREEGDEKEYPGLADDEDFEDS